MQGVADAPGGPDQQNRTCLPRAVAGWHADAPGAAAAPTRVQAGGRQGPGAHLHRAAVGGLAQPERHDDRALALPGAV